VAPVSQQLDVDVDVDVDVDGGVLMPPGEREIEAETSMESAATVEHLTGPPAAAAKTYGRGKGKAAADKGGLAAKGGTKGGGAAGVATATGTGLEAAALAPTAGDRFLHEALAVTGKRARK